MSTVSPVRHPDLRSPGTMAKRAWWLVGLNILIPGSAQLLAGNRRLGRFGVSTTFLLWVLVILAAILYLASPVVVYAVATNIIALTIVQILLVAYVVLWIVLTLDTLRLARIVRATPKARPFIAGLAIVALAATAGTAGYAAMLSGVTRTTLDELFSDGNYQEPIDGQYNILLLGGDAGPDRAGLRPDSISVVSIDAETGAATTIGVPRNFERARFSDGSPLWGPFPNGYDCGDECLISYLYTYATEHPELYPDAQANGSTPGIEATRDAVSGVTGLTLHYYVLIDMQGFAQLVDALGGVTIDVPERTAIGPITAPEPYYYIEPGSRKMDGETALWYGRSRFDSSDFDRMERQRQVQEAILTQFEPANVLGKFQDIASAGTQVVSTDVPTVMLPRFVDLVGKTRALPVTKVELVPGVVDTVYPDYAVIHALVSDAVHPPEAG
ncbi:MAG: LytR family transcriptional regulator [Microbacteriaceae bacterium]|nr:LytR family transcriptional regulator [Microbacteriaceae bacterium]HEV7957461.1 LCP family protein [Marisediminicola sp.]